MVLRVGVVRESEPGERRVALVAEAAGRLAPLGVEVLVEQGAGQDAWITDADYAGAGCHVLTHDEVVAAADLLVCVHRPAAATLAALRPGTALVGLLHAGSDDDYRGLLLERGLTAFSLEGIPRTLSRAQSMDVLTSQANVAGYKAVLVAAAEYGRYFPMLSTAAGTAPPATVLVLGAGVAGLQAIGTARRLGAVVAAYDVRPQARGDAESVGATFLELSTSADGAGAGGYARALSEEEQRAQRDELNAHIARHDIVITTAQVPGRRPPVLVCAEALRAMRPGSVVVDLAAGPLGGNVEGVRDRESTVLGSGVTVVGAGNLPATVPGAASAAYSRNVTSFLAHLLRDGELIVDPDDEIQRGCLVASAPDRAKENA